MAPAKDARAFFLKCELRVGLTFASIALYSRQIGHGEKADRNRLAARRAYEALLRFRKSTSLTGLQSKEFERGLEDLGQRLRNLGEAV
jgi:hypothetical protein